MRETYWNLYVKLVYKSCYYKYFQSLFGKINWILTIFCSVVSLSSIAAWGIWKTHPAIWSVLICVSQLIQAMFPKLPYNDLLSSTKFMSSSLDKLLIQLKTDWLKIQYLDSTEEEILKLIKKHETSYSELVSQFFAGTYLPTIKYCEKKADRECNIYFHNNFPSE